MPRKLLEMFAPRMLFMLYTNWEFKLALIWISLSKLEILLLKKLAKKIFVLFKKPLN